MKKHTTPILIFACSTFALHAQQVSPLVINHDLPNLSDLGTPGAGFPQLKLQLRVPGNLEDDPPVVEGDLTIGMFDWGSVQNGIFQLNNNPLGGSGGSWTWQRGTPSGAPRVEMELSSNGTLRLFGDNPNDADSIVLRPTAADVTLGETAGVFVNGSRLISLADLADSIPAIQSVTLQVSEALSLGDVSGIIGAGSMAAGMGASVYGSGSLAFGTGAHVGAPFTLNSQGQPTFLASPIAANDAVALGKDSNARGHGAMAFGTRANAGTAQSIAIGEDAAATGGTSIYWGGAGYVMGSVAVGTKAKASGTASSAFGLAAQAHGDESIAIGPMAIAWPGTSGSVALGWSASAGKPGSLALGNMSRSESIGGICLGSTTFNTGYYAAAIGNFTEATGTGMIAVGTAPSFTGLTANANWDDMNSVVFIVGGGKPGAYVGGTGGWALSDWAVTRRTSLSVTRGGDVKAGGKVAASKAGGLLVPDTLEAKNGTTRLQGIVIIDRQGDISMGAFTATPPPIATP